MLSNLVSYIANGIWSVISGIINAAKTVLNFKSYINLAKTIFGFFPPVFTIAAICGLTFLTGLAVKRIFFT